MKKRVIKIGVLIIVFAAALVISSLVINRGSMMRLSIWERLRCRGSRLRLTAGR